MEKMLYFLQRKKKVRSNLTLCFPARSHPFVQPPLSASPLLSAKNKPFSAQTAADHLQTEGIKKAVAQRALDSLVEKGKVTLKECGKTKVRGPAPPPGPHGA